MDDALSRSQALVASFEALVREELPAGVELFDAHVHLGVDIDGMRGDLEELLRIQRAHRITRSFMFCLDEPDRQPGFRAPNDRTLAYAEASGGELIPFVRLDLGESPIEEAERCLAAGARDQAAPAGAEVPPRRRAACPGLRAGRRPAGADPDPRRPRPAPIADALARLMDRYEPQLIVAHAGIADLAALARYFGGRPGVFFDTSVWSPLDLLDLYRLVSPEQVLYASDYPYGQQPSSLFSAIRTARMAGLDETQLEAMLGGSARRIAAGELAYELTAPRGPQDISHPLTFARIHQYLSMATPLLWTRQADTIGVLGLALNACDERSNGHREETERIRELLLTARDLWLTFPEAESERERAQVARAAFRLLHLANIVSVTSHG